MQSNRCSSEIGAALLQKAATHMVDKENAVMANNRALTMAGFDDVEGRSLEPFSSFLPHAWTPIKCSKASRCASPERAAAGSAAAGGPATGSSPGGASSPSSPSTPGGLQHDNMAYAQHPCWRYAASVNFCRMQQLAFFLE